MKPGIVEGAFRAPFSAGQTLSWTLGTSVAVADPSYSPCPLAPSDSPPPPSGEGGYGYSSKLPKPGPYEKNALLGKFDFLSNGFDEPTGALSSPLGPTPPPSTPTPRSPTIVSVHFVEADLSNRDGVCGGWEVDALVDIDVESGRGEERQRVATCSFNSCNSPQPILISRREIDPDKSSMILRLRAVDRDRGICGWNDDQLFDQSQEINLNLWKLGGNSFQISHGTPGKTRITFGIEIISSYVPPKPVVDYDPQLCFLWNTAYVDQGFGENVIGLIPASYAEYHLWMRGPKQRAAGVDFHAGGTYDPRTGALLSSTPGIVGCETDGRCFLDANGCTPAGLLNPDDLIHRLVDGESLEMVVRVRTNFQRTGNGARQRFAVRSAVVFDPSNANDPWQPFPDLSYWDNFTSVGAAPMLVQEYSSRNYDTPFPGGVFTDQEGWRVPPPDWRWAASKAPEVDAAAVVSQALVAPELIPSHLAIPPTSRTETQPVTILVGAGVDTVTRPTSPQLSCTSNTNCTGAETRCVVSAAETTGKCACSSDAECRFDLGCIHDSDPQVRRCGSSNFESAYQPYREARNALTPAIPELVFVGPASRPPDATQLCTHEGHCPIAGQTCADLRGFACEEGEACYCRWVHQARWKFVTGHEFGHLIERYVLGEVAVPDYIFECDVDEGCEGTIGSSNRLYDPPGMAGGPCSCDHVNAANRQHCLQSLELTKDAWKEGYGHFFAAALFNAPTNVNGTSSADSCRFAYYKEILADTCPDPAAMDCSTHGEWTRVMPPFAVDCSRGDKWRNNNCGGSPTQPNPELEQMGTEQDWLQFFWNWNRRGPSNSSFAEMMAAQRQVCHREHFTDPEPPGGPLAGDCIAPNGVWRAGCEVPLCGQVSGVRPTTAGVETISGNVAVVWGQPRQPVAPVEPSVDPNDTPEQRTQKLEEYRDAFNEYRVRYGKFAFQRSLEEGVRAYYTAQGVSGDLTAEFRLQHFQSMGDSRGVNENTAP